MLWHKLGCRMGINCGTGWKLGYMMRMHWGAGWGCIGAKDWDWDGSGCRMGIHQDVSGYRIGIGMYWGVGWGCIGLHWGKGLGLGCIGVHWDAGLGCIRVQDGGALG